jgi:hypothetical protein
MRALIIIVVLAISAGTAAAYPQFQLSRDSVCSGCHISPAGGGMLSENGTNTAEGISALGTNPEFMYGKVPTPEWLQLGGDIRAQGGYLQAPQRYLWAFPMQGDIYAAATKDKLSLHLTVGLRTAQEGNEAATYIWAREHYVQWQQEAGSREGLFVRAGHLMPVFGLRWVEHPFYVRRFGGTPLFSETYGLSASMVSSRFEVHASGFVKNPIIDPVRHESGGAVYGELRLSDSTQIGAGAMADARDSDWYTIRGVATAKHYLAGPDVILQGELQLINPHVSGYGHNEIASNVMATWFGPKGLMIDGVWGHYDKHVRFTKTIGGLYRDAFDLNVHWFMTSHLEFMIVNRVEFLALGDGGPTGAWSMLQLHYRL